MLDLVQCVCVYYTVGEEIIIIRIIISHTVATNARIGDVFQRHASALEAFIDDLEQFPRLRVDLACLAIVNAKKLIVEIANVILQIVATRSLGGCGLVLAAMVAVDVEA